MHAIYDNIYHENTAPFIDLPDTHILIYTYISVPLCIFLTNSFTKNKKDENNKIKR